MSLTAKPRKNIVTAAAILVGLACAAAVTISTRGNNTARVPDTAATQAAYINPSKGQVRPCVENSRDSCVTAPSVDLYPSGSEDTTNHDSRRDKTGVWKQIGGVVQSAEGTQLTLRTSSNRTFTAQFPLAIADWWNAERGPHYGNYQFGAGDTITIDYMEPANQTSTSIEANQIQHSAIAIDPASARKTNIQRYSGR